MLRKFLAVKLHELLAVALLVLVAGNALAATISSTFGTSTGKGVYLWEQVNNDDTAGAMLVEAGCYRIFASGTQATADFELQFDPTDGTALTDINSNLVSSGGYRYTSVTGLGYQPTVALPLGYASFAFNSAGGYTQDLDLRLVSNPGGC